jgi:hypothetical protein
MTFFMIELTNSLHNLANATIKYTCEPTRSCGEFAFNLGVDNWDQTYGNKCGGNNVQYLEKLKLAKVKNKSENLLERETHGPKVRQEWQKVYEPTASQMPAWVIWWASG